MLLIAAVRNILRSVIRILGLAREDEGGALVYFGAGSCEVRREKCSAGGVAAVMPSSGCRATLRDFALLVHRLCGPECTVCVRVHAGPSARTAACAYVSQAQHVCTLYAT